MKEVVSRVAPLLRGRGFRKSRHTFNREPEPGLVQVLGFQMGQHHPPGTVELPDVRPNLYGAFTINLGLWLQEAAELSRPGPRPKFVRDADCHVRWRIGNLLPKRGDWWWRLDASVEELAGLVDSLLVEDALPFLDRFDSREELLHAWHARDPLVSDYGTAPPFTIAVVHAVRGEKEPAREIIAAELRETDRPQGRRWILDAAERLGLGGSFTSP
jgi:hypothetical protein